MGSTILLIDDDKAVLDFLGRYLQHEGHTVITADNGAEAVRLAYIERPDLVVLDLMLPEMDGWEICARLRELADFRIILLSARSSEADKLRGFRMGVDDYVTKPFSPAELGARIQVVLARKPAIPSSVSVVYTSGSLTVDMEKRQVRRGQELIPLTRTEFRLLEYLIQQHGKPVLEETLARELWGPYRQSDTTVVRRFIWALRQKLEDDPRHPTRILTVRGFGYRLGTAPLRPPEEKK